MNPETPDEQPQQPQTEQTPTTPIQPTVGMPQPQVVQPQTGHKKLVVATVLIVLVVGAAVAAWFVLQPTKKPETSKSANTTTDTTKQTATTPKATEQAFINPLDGKKTPIDKQAYYDVLVGTNHYFGRVAIINSEYLRLAPTAYMSGQTLTLSGNELHGPEAATYFRTAQIKSVSKLSNTTIITALKSAGSTVDDSYPSSDIDKYAKAGQLQAFTFADGKVFFTSTNSLSGALLSSGKKVYYLKQSSSGTQTNTSLVVATPVELKSYTAAKLVYWQNMKSTSQITKAVAQYEKQNP